MIEAWLVVQFLLSFAGIVFLAYRLFCTSEEIRKDIKDDASSNVYLIGEVVDKLIEQQDEFNRWNKFCGNPGYGGGDRLTNVLGKTYRW